MARRIIRATIRIEIEADVEEITDGMAMDFASESAYEIPSADVFMENGEVVRINVTGTEWEETVPVHC